MTVSDITGATAVLDVVGSDAASVVARAVEADRETVAALAAARASRRPVTAFVVRVDDAPLPGYAIWAPVAQRQLLIERLVDAGAIEIDPRLDEALRIEAGRPAFGIDMTDETIPLEAGLLERAISTTKGCYVGQEVIIRVLHRGGGRVARRLVRLMFDPAVTSPPRPETAVVRRRQGDRPHHERGAGRREASASSRSATCIATRRRWVRTCLRACLTAISPPRSSASPADARAPRS